MSAGVKYIVPAFIDLRSSGFDFVMSKHLITNRSYKDFVDNSKVKFAYSHDARFNHDNKPVVGVRYDHAIKYCEWLSVILGKDVRLPTIEEWEGVAKYGQEKIYSTSSGLLDKSQANYNFSRGMTTNVDEYESNFLGIHDMTGNALEWTNTSENDIVSESFPIDVKKGLKVKRYLKGGAWPFSDNYCRNDCSILMSPRSDYYFIGFRPIIKL